jgi:hypothetical protein
MKQWGAACTWVIELDGCALISYADAKPPNQHVQDLALGPRDQLINRTPESQRYILLFYRQSGQPSNHLAEMPAVARPKAVHRNRRAIIGTNLPLYLQEWGHYLRPVDRRVMRRHAHGIHQNARDDVAR